MENDAELNIVTSNISDSNPYDQSVAPLTEGIVHIYQPPLTEVQKLLEELTHTEKLLFDEIHKENLRLSEVQFSDELQEMFGKIELYQARLVNIKKDMKYLHEKSIKLKKRAMKLQRFREKQDYVKQQKEADLKDEQDLIGAPLNNSTQSVSL